MTGKPRVETPEQIWDRFCSSVEPDLNGGCLLWAGQASNGGYGRFLISRKNVVQAHRFAYEHERGPIPPGLHVDHLCRVRCCVNPTHLEPVTPRENLLRGNSLAAIVVRTNTCKHGHLLTGDNVLVRKRGRGRECVECKRRAYREWKRRWTAKRREARLSSSAIPARGE